MRAIGMVTTGMAAGIAIFATVVGISLIPDLQRYLKMRQM